MVNHRAIQLACRAQALTLEVCTTGSTSLAATGSTYTRAAGSFLTDGFAIGMQVTPSGFSDTTPRTIIAPLTATVMTVDSAPTTQVADAGRTLAVGLPMKVGAAVTRAWENVAFTPDAGTPWVEEEYEPGATTKEETGPFGTLTVLPLYRLRFYGPTGVDILALAAYADATIAHFAPRTALTVGSDTARVRGRPAPTRTAIRVLEGGAAFTTVTIALELRTANSI